MEKDFSNLDGEVISYDVMPGGAAVTRDNFDDQNFYPADGGDVYATFEQLPSFSNASGRGRARRQERRAKRDERRSGRQTRRTERTASKNAARETRAQAKYETAASQGKLAESLGAENRTRAQEQLIAPTSMSASQSSSTTPDKKGLSTNAMIGIGVGAVVVIGIVYMMTRKGKTGK